MLCNFNFYQKGRNVVHNQFIWCSKIIIRCTYLMFVPNLEGHITKSS